MFLYISSLLCFRYLLGNDKHLSDGGSSFWPFAMADGGILNEAQWLLDLGLLPNSNSATRAIGYRQVCFYLLWLNLLNFEMFLWSWNSVKGRLKYFNSLLFKYSGYGLSASMQRTRGMEFFQILLHIFIWISKGI